MVGGGLALRSLVLEVFAYYVADPSSDSRNVDIILDN